jgi:hypothetical protein
MKVGDVYPTRDGRKATVTKVDGVAVRIEILPEPQEPITRWVWANSGKANLTCDSPFDLLLPPKTIKAQRVIEYEGSEEWVKRQMNEPSIYCPPSEGYANSNGTIREVSRKFL